MVWNPFKSRKRYDCERAALYQPPNDVLYVILPYFNYCHFERRKTLFLEFVERIKTNQNIRIIVSEATFASEKFQLPKNIDGVYMHFGFITNHHIWIKENLINLAISKLPQNWKYVAWIDADLTFLNPNWAINTMQKLCEYHVVQLFHTAVNMGPNGEAMKIDRSFAYMHRESGHEWVKTYKYGFWHPGFAWAMRRDAYDQLGGLIDFGILGSGDHHMALAFIGKVDCSHPHNISKDYATKLMEFQTRAYNLELGYVPGTILHHWHGRLEDRKYVERWQILTKGIYMPRVDVYKNNQGLIQLTPAGMRLAEKITNYFIERKEDNMNTS